MRPIVEIYFYPRPPRGGRHNSLNGWATDIKFLSTPSARRATKRVTQKGGDRRFLSTPSARRATSRRAIRSLMGAYFYPRPPRGGRQSCPHSRLQRLGISIHALREEGDLHPGDVDWPPVISIHALREEGDISSSAVFSAMGVFLSTPSARRATSRCLALFHLPAYFYPRPPRGGRRLCHLRYQRTDIISIHALREEGDSHRNVPRLLGRNFYPRPPRGGRLHGADD